MKNIYICMKILCCMALHEIAMSQNVTFILTILKIQKALKIKWIVQKMISLASAPFL